MAKSAQDRLDKWNARYAGDSMPAVMAGYKEKISAKLAGVFELQVNIETGVKAILAEAACPTIQNPAYLAFARQCTRITLKFSGGQLLKEIDLIINIWVGRGLDRDTLEKVRNTVFSIAAPAP